MADLITALKRLLELLLLSASKREKKKMFNMNVPYEWTSARKETANKASEEAGKGG